MKSIIDAHFDFTTSREVSYYNPGAHGQSRVGGGVGMTVVRLATVRSRPVILIGVARSHSSLCVCGQRVGHTFALGNERHHGG